MDPEKWQDLLVSIIQRMHFIRLPTTPSLIIFDRRIRSAVPICRPCFRFVLEMIGCESVGSKWSEENGLNGKCNPMDLPQFNCFLGSYETQVICIQKPIASSMTCHRGARGFAEQRAVLPGKVTHVPKAPLQRGLLDRTHYVRGR